MTPTHQASEPATDRELLEAAARSIGSVLTWDGDNPPYPRASPADAPHWNPHWNPLTDDGDALRLAVKIGRARTLLLTVSVGGADCEFQHPMTLAFEACDGGDIASATRRAIVRAAAALAPSAPAPKA